MVKSIDVKFCSNIATIPQFGGTCWFNAILMASLYSQNSRKLLLRISKKWDKTNKFLMIIRNILLKHYKNSHETQSYLSKLKPEALIFKMLNKYEDIGLKRVVKTGIKINKDYRSIPWYQNYINFFYNILDGNVIYKTYIN